MSNACPVKDFDIALSQQLELLMPKPQESILSLEWISRGLDFALIKHKEAMQLISSGQFPLPPSDDKWMNHYFDQTIRILDVCNALSASISDMEQGHLLLRYAALTLGDRDTGFHENKLLGAVKTLREWVDTIQSPQHAKVCTQKLSSLLQAVCESLPAQPEMDAEKGEYFWVVLYGANATVVVMLCVLSFALSRTVETLSISMPLPNEGLWSASILHLLQLAREEAWQCISTGSVCCLGDLNILNNYVTGFLKTLDALVLEKEFPLTGERADNLNAGIQVLNQLMDVLAGGFELVGRKVNEIFQAVVASRSVLIKHFVKHDL